MTGVSCSGCQEWNGFGNILPQISCDDGGYRVDLMSWDLYAVIGLHIGDTISLRTMSLHFDLPVYKVASEKKLKAL